MRSEDEDVTHPQKKKKGPMMVLQKVLLRVQAPDILNFSPEEKRRVLARILKLDPRERKEEDIANLKLLTQDLDFFTKINSKKFNQEAKLDEKICGRLKYESFSKGQTVIEFGAKADKFFILLSGEVSIFLAKSPEAISEEEQSLSFRSFKKFTHTGLSNYQEEIDEEDKIARELTGQQGNNKNPTKSPYIEGQQWARRESYQQIHASSTQSNSHKYTKRYSMMVPSPSAILLSGDRKHSLNSNPEENNNSPHNHSEDHQSDKYSRRSSFQADQQKDLQNQGSQSPKLSCFGENSPQTGRNSGQAKLSIFNSKIDKELDGNVGTPLSCSSNHRSLLIGQINRSREDEHSPLDAILNRGQSQQLHRSSFMKKSVTKDNFLPGQFDAMAALKQFQKNIQEEDLRQKPFRLLTSDKIDEEEDERKIHLKNPKSPGKSIQQLAEELQQLESIKENNEGLNEEFKELPQLQQKFSSDRENMNSNNVQKQRSQRLVDLHKGSFSSQAFGNLHLNEIQGFERLFTDSGVFKFQYKDKLRDGSTFGELGILEGKPRSALIICSLDSEFAIMEKNDYQELLAERDRKHLRQKFEFLKQHIFPDLTNDAIKKIFYSFQKKTFKMHDVIFCQGDMPNGVFIIIKGEMSLSQKLEENDNEGDEESNQTDRGEKTKVKNLENGQRTSEAKRRATSQKKPLRIQLRKVVSRTFAVIGMGEYFGEEDLLLKDNLEQRHYTATCTSIKASAYFIEAGFFMRFLKSKPNSQSIIQQRLMKKIQWRQQYRDRVSENVRKHKSLSKIQQSPIPINPVPAERHVSPSSQIFSCVPLSARTLKRFSDNLKSQALPSPTVNSLASKSSKQIIQPNPPPPPSLSFLLRELKPLGPIPKAAHALSSNSLRVNFPNQLQLQQELIRQQQQINLKKLSVNSQKANGINDNNSAQASFLSGKPQGNEDTPNQLYQFGDSLLLGQSMHTEKMQKEEKNFSSPKNTKSTNEIPILDKNSTSSAAWSKTHSSNVSSSKNSILQTTLSGKYKLSNELLVNSKNSPFFKNIPVQPSNNKAYCLSADRVQFSQGIKSKQPPLNIMIEPLYLTSRRELSQEEKLLSQTQKNDGIICSPTLNSRHLVLAKTQYSGKSNDNLENKHDKQPDNPQESTINTCQIIGSPKPTQSAATTATISPQKSSFSNNNSNLQANLSSKNFLMNMCLRKIKLKTDSIDSILRFEDLQSKISPKKQSLQFFTKPSSFANQIADPYEEASQEYQQQNSNINQDQKPSFQLFPSGGSPNIKKLPPAIYERQKIRKISNIESEYSQSPQQQRPNYKARSSLQQLPREQEESMRVNGSFDSRIDHSKLKQQVQEILLKHSPSKQFRNLAEKYDTQHHSPNNFNVVSQQQLNSQSQNQQQMQQTTSVMKYSQTIQIRKVI